ncbi:hypothetical protein ACLOJK_018550 [Asimina triloba]
MSNLLFSESGVGDLNMDNVDQPLGLPYVDASILSGSFFSFASPGYAERSPPFVHRAGSSGDRDSDNDFSTSSSSKSVDAVSMSAVELVASRESRAAEAVIPDNDDGSGSNSSVGQHVPTGNANDRRNTRPLHSSMRRCLSRTLSSFRDEFIKSLDDMDGPNDFDYLLDLCGDLE